MNTKFWFIICTNPTIIDLAKARGEKVFYICLEFGPIPYIQQLLFTKENTVNQWEVNMQMMEYLKANLKG